MVGERYHATTQNRFYPDMSNVNKNFTMEGKIYQSTYVKCTFYTYIIDVFSLKVTCRGSKYTDVLLL